MIQEVPLVTNGLSDLQIQQILSIMQDKGTTQYTNSKVDVVGTSSSLLQTFRFVTNIVAPPLINYR